MNPWDLFEDQNSEQDFGPSIAYAAPAPVADEPEPLRASAPSQAKKPWEQYADLPEQVNAPERAPLSPEARALLRTIHGSESAYPGRDPYRVMYGGEEITDFTDHPRKFKPIVNGPNRGNVTSAAGGYQFLGRSWDEAAKALDLPDFSPENQDRAAIWHAENTYRRKTGGRDLISDIGAAKDDPVKLEQIGRALSGWWTSLPGGIEPNPATRSFSARFSRQLAQAGDDGDFGPVLYSMAGGRRDDRDNTPISQSIDTTNAPRAKPWERFQGQSEPPRAAKPWEQYQAVEKTAAPEPGGILDYPIEAAKGLAVGAKGLISSALKSGGVLQAEIARKQIENIDAAVPPDPGDPFTPDISISNREREDLVNRANTPVKEQPLYQAGEAVDEFGRETLKAAPGWENSWTRGISGAVGSLVTGVAIGAVPYVGPAAAGATFLAAGSGEAAERAIREGATDEQVRRAGTFGSLAGATDVVDLLIASTGSTGRAMGLLARVGKKAVLSALAEGGQEGFQQFIQNLIAQGVYKPDQDLMEDVPRSAVIGAIVGGPVGAIAGAVDRPADTVQPAPQPQPTFVPGVPAGAVPAEAILPAEAQQLDTTGLTPLAEGARAFDDLISAQEPSDDRQVQQGLPSEIGGGQEPVQAGAVEGAGQEAVAPSRVLQTPGPEPTQTAADAAGANVAPSPAPAQPVQPLPGRPVPSPSLQEILDDPRSAAEIRAEMDATKAAADLKFELMNAKARDQSAIMAGAALPPVQSGYVRFYHGGPPDGGNGPDTGGGRWVSPHYVYARDYRAADGRPGKVWYVDIPRGDPAEVAARSWDETISWGGQVGTYRSIELPEVWAQKMKPVPLPPTPGTKAAPVVIETPQDVHVGAEITQPDPTPSQIEAGNYRKRHIKFLGRDISIETEQGGTRTAEDGSWSVPNMPAPYGQILGTKGADGDPLDITIGPNPKAKQGFIIDQINPDTGKFDELKTFGGFDSEAEARAAYVASFSDGKGEARIGAVTAMPVAQFRAWLNGGNHTKALAYKPQAPVKQRTYKAKGPLNLLQFLAAEGGLAPDAGGELRYMGLTGKGGRIIVPGLGFRNLVRPGGMTLDRAWARAVEAGYINDPGYGSTSEPLQTTNVDLLRLISEGASGRHTYAVGDEAAAAGIEANRAQQVEQERFAGARADVQAAMKEHSLVATDEQIDRAARLILTDDADPLNAIDHVIERDALADVDEAAQYQPQEQDDGIAETFEQRTGTTGGPVTQAVEQQARPRQTQDEAQAQRDQPTQDQRGRGEGTARKVGTTSDLGAEGRPQLVIPGAERIGQGEQAQRASDKPLKPKVAQKPADEGLFGDESKQTDLMDLARVAERKPVSLKEQAEADGFNVSREFWHGTTKEPFTEFKDSTLEDDTLGPAIYLSTKGGSNFYGEGRGGKTLGPFWVRGNIVKPDTVVTFTFNDDGSVKRKAPALNVLGWMRHALITGRREAWGKDMTPAEYAREFWKRRGVDGYDSGAGLEVAIYDPKNVRAGFSITEGASEEAAQPEINEPVKGGPRSEPPEATRVEQKPKKRGQPVGDVGATGERIRATTSQVDLIRPVKDRPISAGEWTPEERKTYIDDILGQLSRGEIQVGVARAKLNRFDEVTEGDVIRAEEAFKKPLASPPKKPKAPAAGPSDSVAQPAEQQAEKPTVRGYMDTRGRGVQYHGAASEISDFDDSHYGSSVAYYGTEGFYTTDALDVAHGYAHRRNASVPSMYAIQEKRPSKIVDMEAPISADLMAELRKFMDDKYGYAAELTEGALDDAPANLREFFDNVREVAADERIPADEVQESVFHPIMRFLASQGFDGMSHTGGLRTKTPEHKVVIYFNPSEIVNLRKLSERDLAKMRPGETTVVAKPKAPVAGPSDSKGDAGTQRKTGKGGSLASLGRTTEQFLTPRARRDRTKIEAELRRIVKDVAGRDVQVEFSPGETVATQQRPVGYGSIDKGQQPRALYLPLDRLIKIALGVRDPRSSSYHEAWHDVEFHLLNDNEIEILKAQTEKLRKIVQERFGYTDKEIAGLAGYEVRAHAFETYARARESGKTIPGLHTATRIFEKLRRLIERVRSALNGMGFKTLDDIFAKAFEGEYAGRPDLGTVDVEYLAAKREQRGEDAATFAGKQNMGTIEGRQQAMQGYIARGQPLDRAIRLPFDLFGKFNEKGEWKPGANLSEKAASIIVNAKVSPTSRFSFLNPVLEATRAGLIDRYSLRNHPDYVARERGRSLDERGRLLKAQPLIKSMMENVTDLNEAQALQAILTGEAPPQKAWNALAEPIRAAIDLMGQEAVELGLVSPESFERNRGTYVHRVYKSYEAEQNGLYRMVSNMMGSRRKKIIGSQMKGRGMFHELSVSRLMRDVPGWTEAARGKPQNGEKFVRLDELAEQAEMEIGGEPPPPKIQRTIWWPADQAIPDRYSSFKNQGTWEVRGEKGGNQILWRDFTKAERERMGEILDARYTVTKSFMLAAHDLATGRFYKDIAENENWSVSQKPSGTVITAGEWREQNLRWKTWKSPDIDWVQVPNDEISNTGGKKKWGALAGKYVREEIWRDINEIDILSRPSTWRTLLTYWKGAKTYMSPGVHMNNIMSNAFWFDFADGRIQDFVAGIQSYRTGDKYYQEALENGAFGSDIISQEMRDTVLKPVLNQIMRENTFQQAAGRLGAAGQISKFSSMLWSNVIARGNEFAKSAYQMEDEIFRMGLYLRRRQQGASPREAADDVRRQFIDYDIRAPWVNAARNSVLPFISYTYRSAPLIAHGIATRPWKLVKYMALFTVANALSYALTGGDEDKERKALRDEEQGMTWLLTPRMVRMPFLGGRDGKQPVFLDMRRWIPGGDIFDLTQTHAALPILPSWLTPGGPIMIGAEFLLNHQAFTGQDIVNERTDDLATKVEKTANWAWKALIPNAPWVPNSYGWDNIATTLRGGDNSHTLGTSVASSVGIKLKPLDVEDALTKKQGAIAGEAGAIKREVARLTRLKERGKISENEHRRLTTRLILRATKTQEKAQELSR